MKGFVLGWVALEVFIFVVLLLLSLLYYDRRYKRRRQGVDTRVPRPGFHSTAEVFIDPKDGHRYRVYFNPRTGERDYIQED